MTEYSSDSFTQIISNKSKDSLTLDVNERGSISCVGQQKNT